MDSTIRLPFELYKEIIGFISNGYTLRRLLFTSRWFNHEVERVLYYNLSHEVFGWYEILFDPQRARLLLDHIVTCPRVSALIHHLTIHVNKFPQLDLGLIAMFKKIVAVAINLQSLDFDSSIAGSSTTHYITYQGMMVSTLKQCNFRLERLRFCGFFDMQVAQFLLSQPSITDLDFHGRYDLPPGTLPQCLPNLAILKARMHLISILLPDRPIKHIYCTNADEELDMIMDVDFSTIHSLVLSEIPIMEFMPYMQNLKYIELEEWRILDIDLIEAFLQRLPKLSTIVLGPHVTDYSGSPTLFLESLEFISGKIFIISPSVQSVEVNVSVIHHGLAEAYPMWKKHDIFTLTWNRGMKDGFLPSAKAIQPESWKQNGI